MLPVLVRHVRAAMVEAMDAPFALAARAHGIPRRRLLFRHLLPVALNPLITLFGFSLGTLLSASLLIEVIVGWPGLGPLFLEAILARDFALVLGVVMVSTTLLIAGNLAADLLLYRADPRIATPDLHPGNRHPDDAPPLARPPGGGARWPSCSPDSWRPTTTPSSIATSPTRRRRAIHFAGLRPFVYVTRMPRQISGGPSRLSVLSSPAAGSSA